MADNSTGVKGFFDDYEKNRSLPTPAGIRVEPPEKAEQPTPQLPTTTAREGKTAKATKRARTGRPLGTRNTDRKAKAKIKASMHINASIMDFYRDWSWEERCTLGELIERAMRSYKDAQRPERK